MPVAREPADPVGWVRSAAARLDAIPRPGGGRTLERLQELAALGSGDLSRARIAEGHLDALAILAELGRRDLVAGGAVLAVWAAQPDRMTVTDHPDGWRLEGCKDWCSGGHEIDVALVTATGAEGARIFAVPVDDAVCEVPQSWEARGMAATASVTIDVDVVVPEAAAIGGPDAYVRRPGFGHGGVGVAAVWFGGACTLLDLVRAAALRDAGTRASWGRARADLENARARLEVAAAAIDASPLDRDLARDLAAGTRLGVAEAARRVVALATDLLTTEAVGHGGPVHRWIDDLVVYLTQLPRERVGATYATAPGTPRW